MEQTFSREKNQSRVVSIPPRIPSRGVQLIQHKGVRGMPLENYSQQEKIPATSWSGDPFAQVEETAGSKFLLREGNDV